MKKVHSLGVCPQRVKHRQVKFRWQNHETINHSNTGYTGINGG